jgi:hypothetical protein
VITPLEFLYHFRDLLREAGIRFAITSGMACVYYGLQQNTKDSDWIIDPADLPKLRALLESHERRVPPWRISYRPIFGAPLDARWMGFGWTSHLSIWPSAGAPEEHVDIFCVPPRVTPGPPEPDEKGFASPDVVAWMKRTDRDKDWPIVDGFGTLLIHAGEKRAVLHIQAPEALREVWGNLEAADRAALARERPLLLQLDDVNDDEVLQGLIDVERRTWETINQERYRIFQQVWKDFYRRWQMEELWEWPTSEPFSRQHGRLLCAAEKHGLPHEPLDGAGKAAARERGVRRAILRTGRPEDMVRAVAPPLWRILP